MPEILSIYLLRDTQCGGRFTEISLRNLKNREHAPEPTPRQREVIHLLTEGRSMKEVASELKITTRTVAGHKYAAMELLQLKTYADPVHYISLHLTSLPHR